MAQLAPIVKGRKHSCGRLVTCGRTATCSAKNHGVKRWAGAWQMCGRTATLRVGSEYGGNTFIYSTCLGIGGTALEELKARGIV